MTENFDLEPGLYDSLITLRLKEQLGTVPDSEFHAKFRALEDSESADRIAIFMENLIRRTVESLPKEGRAEAAAALTNSLISELSNQSSTIRPGLDALSTPGGVLQAILRRHPDGSPEELALPSTPLLDTTLLTNSRGEPGIGGELRAEIPSANSVDLLISFIRWSGIRDYLQLFQDHISGGGKVRVLTTTYTNATELRALEALRSIGAEIKVSYDVETTRLHAKAWIFHRKSGFSTAYVGSSNISHAAMTTGLEWNVRISAKRNFDVVDKMKAMFDSYWANGDFVEFDANEFKERTEFQFHTPVPTLSSVEVRLSPFQERLLEQIEVSREAGHSRNLLVSATGTGKTVMSAVDFSRLKSKLGNPRLLFLAHREEILNQAQATFRHVLRVPDFGEKWVGGARPVKFDHVFASIQSLNSSGIEKINPHHFDVVIIDEFHHAAANTYTKLLGHLQPKELLGLTATPERADGLNILQYFGGRIAAELRVWDAIEQQYLAPFVYYGIHDEIDLREIPWHRGKGYEISALENVYTGNDRWARLVLNQLERIVGDVQSMRAIGFCVSVQHASFMSHFFQSAGIPSAVVVGTTDSEERATSLRELAAGEIKIIFAVDVLNEGVDIPAVDTLLMLRPSESATLFIQQLGRGLRKTAQKDQCTILDFIGLQRTEFRFDLKFRALLACSRLELKDYVERGFPMLPAGCSMFLDSVAQETVLKSIRNALPGTWAKRVSELGQLGDVTLSQYLLETGLELDDIYANGRSWTELRRSAGLVPNEEGSPEERTMLRAVGRLLHIDDYARINSYRYFVSLDRTVDISTLPEPEFRFARMLVESLDVLKSTVVDAVALIRKNRAVCSELRELLDILEAKIDHIHEFGGLLNSPLVTHARYSRLEILAGAGVGGDGPTPEWREGVKWDVASQTDLFLITLDKSDVSFSPKTRYRDYAINRELLHWESQSTTSLSSTTGQRYVNQGRAGTNVAIFARLNKSQRAFTFLGLADYVQHDGDRPIAITWKLRKPLPGDLYAQFSVAVA
jgi:superfamily II DNA or RNA helicase